MRWYPEQVDFTLHIVIKKYKAEPKSIRFELISDRQTVRVKTNDISIELRNRYELYMNLKNNGGEFKASYIPFKHHAVKRKIAFLRWIAFNMDKEMRRIANEENEKENRARTMKALESTFPDAIASEFEEIILKKEK